MDDSKAFEHIKKAIKLLEGYSRYEDTRDDLIIQKERLEKEIWG